MTTHDEALPPIEIGTRPFADIPTLTMQEVFGPEAPSIQWTLDTALAWLQANLPHVAKGETAKVEKDGKHLYSYQYADLTDVSEAVLPLLGRLGLSWRCRPTMKEIGGTWRFVLHYELKHLTGGNIEGDWPLPDRADPQTVGSAITYARRYCLCSVTGLAPGGDDDGTAAKEASKQGERLSTASELSLPPGDTDRLVAALEPQALTPLADYWMLWEIVTKRRAADKPSPIEHDGKILTWSQLFGFSLAQRIEQLETPAQCRTFFDEAKAAGGNARLPWLWDGTNAADRLKAHGSHLNFLLDEQYRVTELAVASASDMQELDKATALVEALAGKGPAERYKALLKFTEEREEAMRRAAQPVEHDGPAPLDGPDDDTAPPGGEAYERLRKAIWTGGPVSELNDELNGAVERGEITQEAFAELTVMLFERPEPAAGAYTWFMWQLNTSITEGDLDAVKAGIKAVDNEVYPEGLTGEEERSLMGIIAGKRVQMKGEQYR